LTCPILITKNDKFQDNFLQPGIMDARARYQTAARWLRNTALEQSFQIISVTWYTYRYIHFNLMTI